jgi:predicted esterase
MNADRLVAGKATFKLQVPFKLSSSGSSEDPKPLIVYLHGYGHNITQFEEAVKTFEDFEAYHLFIQGPFPTKIEHQNNKKRGYAWYLYGDQKTYNQHLEMSSEFVQDVIDQHLGHINVSEICVIGYSMGAYLAGYWALTRWKHTNKVIMLSGRFKIEMIKDVAQKTENYRHLSVLAVHGKSDSVVKPEPQQESIQKWSDSGFNGSFVTVKGGHALTEDLVNCAKNWLISNNYRTI